MAKDNEPDRWQKRPPISGMPIEEMKRRVADGIANRRKAGLLPPAHLKVLRTQASGPTLDKKQRRVLMAAGELAIYSLANNERSDYCGAAETINAVRRQAGMPTKFMAAILKGVAEQAAELSGEPVEVLDGLARHWLDRYFTPSERLISITKGQNHDHGKEKTHR